MRSGEGSVLFEVAFVVLLCTVVAGRILSERALRLLSADQKVSLVDAFRGQRAYGLIPLVALFAAYYALMSYTAVSRPVLFVAYWMALLAYLVWSFWFTRRTLSTLNLPRAYLTQFGIARAIQYIGLGVSLAAVIGDGI